MSDLVGNPEDWFSPVAAHLGHNARSTSHDWKTEHSIAILDYILFAYCKSLELKFS